MLLLWSHPAYIKGNLLNLDEWGLMFSSGCVVTVYNDHMNGTLCAFLLLIL